MKRERAVVSAVVVLSFGAIFLDNYAAPALHNDSPLWALAFLLLLILRRREDESAPNDEALGIRWSWSRVAVFATLHAGIISFARLAGSMLAMGATKGPLAAAFIAAMKYLVIVPTLVLFTPAGWQRLARRYGSELTAAALVLFTWNPHRIFATAWPWYSAWLGRFVHATAGLMVPGLGYIAGQSPAYIPTLVGPRLGVSILFDCSGLNGVKLFELLFGIVVLVDWNRLNKRRALGACFGGMAAMIFANAMRIALMVILGNRVSPGMVARFHVNAGWVFFTAVFLAFLFVSYRWLLGVKPGPHAGSRMA